MQVGWKRDFADAAGRILCAAYLFSAAPLVRAQAVVVVPDSPDFWQETTKAAGTRRAMTCADDTPGGVRRCTFPDGSIGRLETVLNAGGVREVRGYWDPQIFHPRDTCGSAGREGFEKCAPERLLKYVLLMKDGDPVPGSRYQEFFLNGCPQFDGAFDLEGNLTGTMWVRNRDNWCRWQLEAGVWVGSADSFYPDGKSYSSWPTKHGRLMDGVVRFTYPTGELLATRTISDGEFHGVARYYYQDGAFAAEGRLDGTMPDGEWRTWYSDGTLRSIASWVFGKGAIGTWKWYHPNGDLGAEMVFKHGVRARGRYWDASGKMVREEWYRGGKLHRTKDYGGKVPDVQMGPRISSHKAGVLVVTEIAPGLEFLDGGFQNEIESLYFNRPEDRNLCAPVPLIAGGSTSSDSH